MKRNIYLKTIPIAEAVSRLKAALDREGLVRVETVPSDAAMGRITARPVIARYSSPTFHSAAMDGVAIKAASSYAAREGAPVRLEPGRDFKPVNTGHPLPEGMDAVVMIENVVMDGEAALIEAPVAPWTHVRRIGEDIVATEMLLPRHRRLSAYDVGALLSCGVFDVEVYETVRLALIPTGDEVLDYTLRPEPGPGQVVESNSMMLASLARSWGFEARRMPPVKDDPESLAKAFEEALASDAHVAVLLAGSSAGSKDYSRLTMEKFGEVLVHGIAAMPGKPSLFGVCRGKLAVGAPGYPVSAAVCFEELVHPLCSWLMRTKPRTKPMLDVTLARAAPSKLGLEEFLRLAVGRVGESWVGLPLARGAGMITTMTKAQAVARIPANAEGAEAGAVVRASALVDEDDLARTLVAVGSHDNTLDLLADMLMRRDDPVRLASSHVGSMGGLTALKNGSALLAGSHLFDPESGDYNFPFLEKYLPGMDVAAVTLAIRHQGLIVPAGNPKSITGVKDLDGTGLRFINRQRGAGTRILFDYHLKKDGIDPAKVAGYANEEFTHMAVAVNVLTGAADCGLGAYAAAKALNLGFIPVARERYDLIIPRRFLDDPRIKAVLAVIRSEDFKRRIEELGGYETALTGREMRPGDGLSE
jgi:putative molybdopterin biosynthesis protein